MDVDSGRLTLGEEGDEQEKQAGPSAAGGQELSFAEIGAGPQKVLKLVIVLIRFAF